MVNNDGVDSSNDTYNYASIINMIQYLQGYSRPYIIYPVSACARFVNSTRRSHEITLERIGKYLKGTLEEGLILKPPVELDVDFYCGDEFSDLLP